VKELCYDLLPLLLDDSFCCLKDEITKDTSYCNKIIGSNFPKYLMSSTITIVPFADENEYDVNQEKLEVMNSTLDVELQKHDCDREDTYKKFTKINAILNKEAKIRVMESDEGKRLVGELQTPVQYQISKAVFTVTKYECDPEMTYFKWNGTIMYHDTPVPVYLNVAVVENYVDIEPDFDRILITTDDPIAEINYLFSFMGGQDENNSEEIINEENKLDFIARVTKERFTSEFSKVFADNVNKYMNQKGPMQLIIMFKWLQGEARAHTVRHCVVLPSDFEIPLLQGNWILDGVFIDAKEGLRANLQLSSSKLPFTISFDLHYTRLKLKQATPENEIYPAKEYLAAWNTFFPRNTSLIPFSHLVAKKFNCDMEGEMDFRLDVSETDIILMMHTNLKLSYALHGIHVPNHNLNFRINGAAGGLSTYIDDKKKIHLALSSEIRNYLSLVHAKIQKESIKLIELLHKWHLAFPKLEVPAVLKTLTKCDFKFTNAYELSMAGKFAKSSGAFSEKAFAVYANYSTEFAWIQIDDDRYTLVFVEGEIQVPNFANALFDVVFLFNTAVM
jgi:hypothetical protein